MLLGDTSWLVITIMLACAPGIIGLFIRVISCAEHCRFTGFHTSHMQL